MESFGNFSKVASVHSTTWAHGACVSRENFPHSSLPPLHEPRRTRPDYRDTTKLTFAFLHIFRMMTTPLLSLCFVLLALLPAATTQIMCYICNGRTGDDSGCSESPIPTKLTMCRRNDDCCSITVTPVGDGNFTYSRGCSLKSHCLECCCTNECNADLPTTESPTTELPTTTSSPTTDSATTDSATTGSPTRISAPTPTNSATATLIDLFGGLFLVLLTLTFGVFLGI